MHKVPSSIISNAASNSPALSKPLVMSNHSSVGNLYVFWHSVTLGFAIALPMNSLFPTLSWSYISITIVGGSLAMSSPAPYTKMSLNINDSSHVGLNVSSITCVVFAYSVMYTVAYGSLKPDASDPMSERA